MSVGSLVGSGYAYNSSSTPSTFTTNVLSGTGNFTGTINDGLTAGNMAFTKTGTGLQVLQAQNTFTGAVNVNQGILSMYYPNSNFTTVGMVNVATGATFAVSTHWTEANIASLLACSALALCRGPDLCFYILTYATFSSSLRPSRHQRLYGGACDGRRKQRCPDGWCEWLHRRYAHHQRYVACREHFRPGDRHRGNRRCAPWKWTAPTLASTT